MSREWKPGDVAMVNDRTGLDSDAIAVCVSGGPIGQAHWRLMHKRGGEVWGSVSEARPLVVIDPEDREQVERLAGGFLIHATAQRATIEAVANTMQAALREFADPTPPKPDEPLGLGAVVEDDKGCRYSRVAGDDEFPWAKSPVGEWQIECFGWDEFAAVRVLSEGWSA